MFFYTNFPKEKNNKLNDFAFKKIANLNLCINIKYIENKIKKIRNKK